jgi:hypothetical protein
MTLRLIASILLLAFPVLAQEAKPDFSGTWTLNAAKSDFGPMPPADSRTDIITHKEPVLKESVNAGDQQWEATYTTDGKESKNTLMGYEMTSTAHWEATALVIESKLDFGGAAIIMHGTVTLSADGKVLTKKTHISGMMEGDQTLVFDKQ